MVRNILAVIAGFFGGGLLVFAVEALGHLIYPPPPGLDLTNSESIAEYVKNMSVGALIAVLAAQCSGSFGGGFITGLISKAKTIPAIVYGVLALIMASINIFMSAHPIWFVILAVILPIPLSLLGNKLSGMLVKQAQ